MATFDRTKAEKATAVKAPIPTRAAAPTRFMPAYRQRSTEYTRLMRGAR